MFQSEAFESNMAKPSWCLEVMTMYFMPASLAVRTHSSALNFTGLNSLAYSRYSATGILPRVHDPLADAVDPLAVVGAGGDGIDAPVNEHAEAGRAPPGHAGVALGGGLIGIGIGLDDLGRALDVERDDRGASCPARQRAG